MSIRVRYAPSPTGLQHLGGVRTALFNYLFAKSQGGAFVVRVEDTDQKRCTSEYLHDLFETLNWLRITPDESGEEGAFAPYIQSKRQELYTQYALELIEKGHAYYCYHSALDEIKEKQDSKNTHSYPHGYDRSSRNLSEEEREQFQKEGRPSVIRLKLPLEGEIEFEDELLGRISRKVEDVIVDPILIKTDGFPTYHLANVVDDHLMEISHVIRSQEWIPSTPVHIFLYKAFHWDPPKIMHLPMVLGEDGQKLSKRRGSISIQEFKQMGVLPQALINCIARLGWSYDDSREFFSMQDLMQLFSEGNINKSPAMFSFEKLKWFNAHYIRSLSDEELAKEVLVFITRESWTCSEEQALILAPLIQERIQLLSECVEQLRPLFEELKEWDTEHLLQKHSLETVHKGLDFALHILSAHFDTEADELEVIIRRELEDERHELKLGQVLMPLRVAVTGTLVSPPILPIIKFIGLEKVTRRIHAFKNIINTQKEEYE